MIIFRKFGCLKFNVDLNLLIRWIPACVLFVLMLSTSGFALAWLPVPIITVFKNLGLCITAMGDSYFFGVKHSRNIKFSIILMIIGSFLSAMTDLTFTI